MMEPQKLSYGELTKAQKTRFNALVGSLLAIGVAVLLFFTLTLLSEKNHARDSWYSYLSDPPEQAQEIEKLSQNAVKVSVGTYIENLREINLKNSTFHVEGLIWFNWEGPSDLDPAHNFRVFKGDIGDSVVVKETHEGNKNYQLVRMDVNISKSYDTKRFPLESHQLRMYVESEYPIEDVIYVADEENSGINEQITVTGYNLLRHDIGAVTYRYASSHGDPELENIDENMITSEVVTAFEINRSSAGLYAKCFIALIGTITWCLISLFICTYHHIDPLGMLPGALFGTVGNIMVGANLLPDALEMGLMEYVNLWGILTILASAVAVININRIRNKYEEKDFARYLGRAMFYIILGFTIVGNIVLPMTAYLRV